MTKAEIKDWVTMLGSNDRERIASIRELLHYANDDGMSAEDRTICQQELERLCQGVK